ncbi:hypothetical protein ACGFZP_14805 [Kitasatospora sp. NPDC048239]|uniref:hypothetical protein n=1 Tax=Kitasatospora sp. NPDC048239 TaxID=3364046 RepID=UPI003711C4CE
MLLDLGRVTGLDAAAQAMITATLARLAAGGRRVALTGAALPAPPGAPWEHFGADGAGPGGAP